MLHSTQELLSHIRIYRAQTPDEGLIRVTPEVLEACEDHLNTLTRMVEMSCVESAEAHSAVEALYLAHFPKSPEYLGIEDMVEKLMARIPKSQEEHT